MELLWLELPFFVLHLYMVDNCLRNWSLTLFHYSSFIISLLHYFNPTKFSWSSHECMHSGDIRVVTSLWSWEFSSPQVMSNCIANSHYAYSCLLIHANLMTIDLLKSSILCIVPFVQEYKGLSVGEMIAPYFCIYFHGQIHWINACFDDNCT